MLFGKTALEFLDFPDVDAEDVNWETLAKWVTQEGTKDEVREGGSGTESGSQSPEEVIEAKGKGKGRGRGRPESDKAPRSRPLSRGF